jgi:WD40 repeat protein
LHRVLSSDGFWRERYERRWGDTSRLPPPAPPPGGWKKEYRWRHGRKRRCDQHLQYGEFTMWRPLEVSDAGVYALDLEAEGDLLATGSADASVALWSLCSRTRVASLASAHHGAVRAVRLLSSSRGVGGVDGSKGGSGAGVDLRLVSGGSDAAVRVWQLEPGGGPRELSLLAGHEEQVNCLEVALPGGGIPEALVCSGGLDAQILLWDLRAPARPVQRLLSEAALLCLHLPQRGELPLLASGNTAGCVEIWDPRAPTRPLGAARLHRSWVRAAAAAAAAVAFATAETAWPGHVIWAIGS